MLDREYAQMYALEQRLWWYRALHAFITSLLSPHLSIQTRSAGALRALDIGCGTGGLLAHLQRLGCQATGLDYSLTGLRFAAQRGAGELVAGDANRLPLAPGFDLVTCVDVLETALVDPERVVAEALRVLRPGGYALLVMAAHQWLLSEHDRAVHSVRRYSLDQLKSLVSGSNVSVVRSSYLFFLTFPLLVLRKLLNPTKSEEVPPVSDVAMPPAWINTLLYALGRLEAQWLARFGLPIGSSAAVLVRKDG